MTNRGRAVATNGPLFSTSLSHAQLSRWRSGNQEIVDAECILGEIYWRKSIGHPKTEKLSEAFSLLVWSDEAQHDNPDDPSRVTATIHMPKAVMLWDANDDAEFWRVSFLVSGVKQGHVHIRFDIGLDDYDNFTYIVPRFNKVPWEGPGPVSPESDSSLARPYRVFVTPKVRLVKTPVTDHLSIQIVQSYFMPDYVKTPFDK